MKRYIRIFLEAIFVVTIFAFTGINCFAAVEVGENYVMYDMRQYDGDSALPYGRGSNGNCYYPKTDNVSHNFPEVYTWTRASLSETNDGVKLLANNVGTAVSTTFDKVPAMYQMSVQKNFCYLILRIKANTTGENTVMFTSLGSNYRRIYDVTYTGEWQSIVLDLSGVVGWEKKNGDGSYSQVTAPPWEKSHFGNDGFGITYDAFGEDIKSEILIGYYVFTDDPLLVPETGRITTQTAYIKGGTDGLFRPSEHLTRLQSAIIVSRLMDIPDDVTVPEDYICRFGDMSETDFGYNIVAKLDSLGVLSRCDDLFEPDMPATVSFLSAMLIDSRLESSVTDASDISDSSKYITRAEGCALINHITDRRTSFTAQDNPFPDVTASHPLYRDICASSMTMVQRELPDGTVKVLSMYPEPDYELTMTVISEIDKKAKERYDSIHNSPNTTETSEKCYYVSPNGNDASDGTTPSTAWKSLDKVNKVGFSSGSTVFFERGGLWRGSLRILPDVTYTAYGEGEKPTIYGSLYDGADGSLWTLVEGTTNVWRFRYDMPDCGSVVFDHGKYHSYKETPSYNGKIYLHRNSSIEFDFTTDISEDLGIFCDNKRDPASDCPLYLRCDEGNPGDLFDSIEFLPFGDIMDVVANKNVVIDNFCLRYGGSHGIGAGTVENLTVQNCEFLWIGGSIQNYGAGGGTMPVRYGNAIESYGAPNGFYVENNYIHQVYDAGITHQMSGGTQANGVQKNIRYANNLIEYCSYSIEYFLGDGSEGTPERYMENVVIEDNIMRYAGFGFGNQRTDRICMSHIKSGSGRNAVSEGFVIRNNIFDRSREMLINISAYDIDDLPLLSQNTYIQYVTQPETPYSTFGRYGTNNARLRFFTKDIAKIVKDRNIDSDARMYHAPKDGLYELPEH